jgi:hypothetical protein
MLARRIISCLDIKDGRVVKGVNFVGLRDAGNPVELAAGYERHGADELVSNARWWNAEFRFVREATPEGSRTQDRDWRHGWISKDPNGTPTHDDAD